MKNIRSNAKYAVLPLAIFLLGSLLTWRRPPHPPRVPGERPQLNTQSLLQPTRVSVRFRPTAAAATIHPNNSHPELLERCSVTCGNELCSARRMSATF